MFTAIPIINVVKPQKHLIMILLTLLGASVAACSPFYSVAQSDVERGYRWIARGKPTQAISTFEYSLQNYPNNILAYIGLADAYAASHRTLDAVDMYTKTLPQLKADENASLNQTTVSKQTIGKRFFSYQNQGIRFPHGVEAYVHFRRGLAYETLAFKYPRLANKYTLLAATDYDFALRLAPESKDPRVRLECLSGFIAPECQKLTAK